MKKRKVITNYTINDFYCTQCGNKGIPLARGLYLQREAGHLKKLYCAYCKKEVNFVEVKPKGPYTVEIFKTEFEKGNFDNMGNRKMTYRQCLSKQR